MGSFLVWVLSAAAVGCVVFGIVAVLAGRVPVMAPATQDLRPNPLPGDRPIRAEDLRKLRFDMGFRGYRMEEVDAAMEQLMVELELRDDEIAELKGALRTTGSDAAAPSQRDTP